MVRDVGEVRLRSMRYLIWRAADPCKLSLCFLIKTFIDLFFFVDF